MRHRILIILFNERLHNFPHRLIIVSAVSPGSAETLFRWGGKINYLLIAWSLGAKNYKIRTMAAHVTAENVGDPYCESETQLLYFYYRNTDRVGDEGNTGSYPTIPSVCPSYFYSIDLSCVPSDLWLWFLACVCATDSTDRFIFQANAADKTGVGFCCSMLASK